MTLTLIGRHNEAGDAASFIFRADEPGFTWRAGQFLHYTLPQANPDGRGIERWFTIASAPFEGQVMLTTRLVEERSTFKAALDALAVGATIEADGLEGDFIVEDPKAKFVFIAGGIGITPYRAILLDLDRSGAAIDATLLYANRDNNIVFRDDLEALAGKHKDFRVNYYIGPERIDEAAIRRAVPDLAAPIFYVSGPEPMVEAFERMMRDMGIPDARLKRDYFPGYHWPL